MRMTIHIVHASGVPVDIELGPTEVDRLDTYITRLLQGGFRAPAHPWPRSPEGLPICSKHQAVMPAREKQGDTWYSHRVVTADGVELFCRGFASGPAEKDGWHHACVTQSQGDSSV